MRQYRTRRRWRGSAGTTACPRFTGTWSAGVASYSLEFLRARPGLRRVYVPIGLGSGICGMICARNALGLDTEIIGVAAANADCYARSLAAGKCVSTESADTIADGMAVRVPNPEALELMCDNLARIVTVEDAAIMQAMRYYFSDVHSIAEGAGAAPLAALLQESSHGGPDEEVGLVLSGGNAERGLYRQALAN